MYLQQQRSLDKSGLIYMNHDIYDNITDGSVSFDSYCFLDKPYLNNNPEGVVLKVGDICWMHPTTWTYKKEKYKVMIVETQIFNAIKTPNAYALCTYMPGGHVAEMRGYFFYRLEFIQRFDPIHILGI